AWQYSMSDQADILIYGCNVAATLDGQQLLSELSTLTDSDVAGSEDLTGAAELGGDWDLEYSVGFVTTESVFSTDFEDEWQWVLNTYTVTTTVDENNGTGALSLREAIIAANANPGADTINLGSGTYVLSRTGDGENAASLGDLDITGQITITGQGVINTIIDASAMSDRIFELTGAGNLTLSGMKIIGGVGDTYAGGAVYNNGGSLTVTDVVFDGNNVGNTDGGTISSSGTTFLNRVTILNSSATNGGAISVSGGTTTLTNVTISSSTATFDGGAIRVNGGTATINFSTIAGNTATGGHGGGVYASGAGTITINSSAFADNTAAFAGADVKGNITSVGHNIIESANGFTLDGTDFSGTITMPAISTDSVTGHSYFVVSAGGQAQGGGNPTGAPSTDIRGFVRDSAPDIGSYELNTAPVLDNTKSPALASVNQNSGAPSGAVGTLISGLVDLATPSGQVDNVTDTAGSYTGIAVTAANTTNGTWWYSINNGSTWAALGAVSSTSARLLAADSQTRIYFQPNAGFSGTIASAITFRAWDRTSGANGSLVSPVTGTETVLDSFSIASFSNNDGSVSWSGNWIESDSGGAGATVGDIDITSGYLRLKPTAVGNSITRQVNLAGAASATFSFSMPFNSLGSGQIQVQVSGNGGSSWNTLETITSGTATGTHSYDITAYTASNTQIRFYSTVTSTTGIRLDDIQVQYAAVGGGTSAFSSATDTASLVVIGNSAPVLTPYAPVLPFTEDSAAYTNTVASLLGSSVTDADGGPEGIGITDITGSNGTLQYSIDGGAWTTFGAVSGSSAFLLKDTDQIRFTPNGISGGTMTMTYRAWDQWTGTAGTNVNTTTNGGTTAFSSATDTVTITTTEINDAPSGANKTITFNEDAVYVLTAADFGFSDVDGNAFNRVWFMSIPAQGQLKYNGSTFAANNWVLRSDIDLGLLTYEADPDENGTNYASFDFQVQDNGGTANGGVNRDPSSNTITFNVTALNDNPTANHGGPYTINEGDSLSLDASGSADIDGDTLTYRWDLNNDATYDITTTSATIAPAWSALASYGIDDDGVYTIGLQVDDGNGGVVTTSTTVTVANVAPTLTVTGAATSAGDATYTLTLTDSDPGNDTISQWIVNWGDGSIDTYVGDPASVTHVYANILAGLTFDITVSAIDEDGQYFNATMLAPAYGGDYVSQFSGYSGTSLGNFAPITDGINGHANIAIMPSGNYLVSGVDSGSILEYQPNGTLVGDFVAASDPNLSAPGGIAYGPDGNLYVADYGAGKIVRFDGT
ncbi:MAG: DUF4347 domain-containing protein, partial [Planctomycetaceae bacterium]|nr:DUF4347 domain-containing protein [Planctomycetaceae bacterium]